MHFCKSAFVVCAIAFGVARGSEDSCWKWDPSSPEPFENKIKVYLFNVKNPVETIAGKNPEVEEAGPYVYKETIQRVDISVNEEDHIVEYKEKHVYEFLPDLSTGSENDVINFINLPFASSVVPLSAAGFVAAPYLDAILNGTEKLVRNGLKVGDILYDGFDASIYTDMMVKLGQTPPPQMEGGRFGLFRGRNGTADNPIEVSTHGSYEHKLGDIISWNDVSELNYWKSEDCNTFKGSDGTVFPPGISQTNTLHFFNPEACRTFPLVFEKGVTVGPVTAYRFKFPDYMLEDARKRSENLCYCRDYDVDFGEGEDSCLKRGALDISRCRQGAPLVSTFPHFLGAHPDYLEGVKGVSPNAELHSSYVDIEPVTGTVVRSSLKFQLNINTEKLKEISKLSYLAEYLFPVMWIDKVYEMPESSLEKLASHLRSSGVDTNVDAVQTHSESTNAAEGFKLGSHLIVSCCLAVAYVFRR